VWVSSPSAQGLFTLSTMHAHAQLRACPRPTQDKLTLSTVHTHAQPRACPRSTQNKLTLSIVHAHTQHKSCPFSAQSMLTLRGKARPRSSIWVESIHARCSVQFLSLKTTKEIFSNDHIASGPDTCPRWNTYTYTLQYRQQPAVDARTLSVKLYTGC